MAVTKIWQIKNGGLSRVVNYASNPDKTQQSDLEQVVHYAAREDKTAGNDEKALAVTGINCNAETALKEMQEVQERFGKTTGNVAYHAYQSFKTGEVSPEQCHRLGVELARKMWGDKYQVLVATHHDTKTLHNHFVLQPVCLWDGKKYDCNKREYYRMRRLSDEMCKRENLTVIENPEKRTPRPIYIAEKNGDPTKYNLMREAIDTALSCSCNYADFDYALRKQGYIIYLNSNYKYATIRSFNSKRGTRLYRLGEQYDRKAIYERLDENLYYDKQNTEDRFHSMFYMYEYYWVQNNPKPKEYDWREEFYKVDVNKASLIELYVILFVMILDLTVQAIRNAYEALVSETYTPEFVVAACMKAKSPELKELGRNLQRYSDQMLLMAEEKFKTVEEINNYISEHELKIQEVKQYREHWRNKLRSAKTPEQIAEYTKKRNECTNALSSLRFQKQVARTLITDLPRVRHLLKGEQNVWRGTDPYQLNMGYKMQDAKYQDNSLTK